MLNERTNKENPGILDLAMDEGRRTAFLKYRLEKRKVSQSEYKEMEAYITSPQCTEDLKRLKNGDYFMDAPFHYRIPKNFSGRKRDVYAWKGSVKFLLSLLTFVMRDYDFMYSRGLYSFRKNVSGRDFLLKLRNFSQPERYYIIKADVSNYVSSIVPELIIPQLEEIWKDDPEFLALMKFLLLRRECIERDGSLVKCEPGGMGGNPLSNHFMNIYLRELDDYFVARSPLYCRYSDDIIIFAETREEAEEYLAFFYRTLEEKKLKTNQEKTVLIMPGEKVEILGCVLEHGRMDIADHSKMKLRRKIRMHAKREVWKKDKLGRSSEEAVQRQIYYCNRIFYGREGKNDLAWARWMFPVISDAKSLHEIDRFIQDSIRYVYWSSFSRKRYRTRYKDLKQMGYQSLVYSYYHFSHQTAKQQPCKESPSVSDPELPSA